MKNNFEKIKSMSLIEFKDFLLGMKIDGTGCGNCVLSDKYCNSKLEDTCEANILNWLNSKTDMTADEMFEELGYKKGNENVYENKKSDIREIIEINEKDYSYEKYGYTDIEGLISIPITEAEDKAIHKKIKELKKWEEDN